MYVSSTCFTHFIIYSLNMWLQFFFSFLEILCTLLSYFAFVFLEGPYFRIASKSCTTSKGVPGIEEDSQFNVQLAGIEEEGTADAP